jgi:glycosyltransferase involved in cell wall biosynthesis
MRQVHGQSSKSRHRVLVDLSMAILGYSGIPQDSRLMFKTLSLMPNVEPTGLVYLYEAEPWHRPILKNRDADDRHFSSLDASLFLLALSGVNKKSRSGFRKLTRRASNYVRLLRTGYQLKGLEQDLLRDALWRLIFQKTLPARDRQLILSQKFAFSDLLYRDICRYTLNSGPSRHFALRPHLDTKDYDFAIFQDSRPITLAPGTVKIYRYHDPIPVTDPDAFAEPGVIRYHFRAIEKCRRDGFYVCNSEITRKNLVHLFPMLEERSFTIPYALPSTVEPASQTIPISEIVRARFSTASFGGNGAGPPREHVLERARLDRPFRYIMALSTLEPRKNFAGVIAAWERIVYQHDPELKLVIVGKPGWRYEATLKAIGTRLPHGQLLHLEDVPFIEVQALYRQAQCLVFPSFAEGFGFPPMEALQCGTPSVVSDIEVHRWVMEDAVLYADPYDVDAIASQIARLAIADDRDDLRAELIGNGQRVLKRYAVDTVAAQWDDLFAKLKQGRK